MRLPCTKCLHHAACEGGAMYNQDVITQSIISPCLRIERVSLKHEEGYKNFLNPARRAQINKPVSPHLTGPILMIAKYSGVYSQPHPKVHICDNLKQGIR